MPTSRLLLSRWDVAVPVGAVLALVAFWGRDLETLALLALSATLIAAVLAAVHHAEVVAHRVGEPVGTLVLAVAVTVIEVALIVSLMVAGARTTRCWLATRCSPRS